MLAHRWAAELVFARPAVTPDSVRTVDLLYATLLEAGVRRSEVAAPGADARHRRDRLCRIGGRRRFGSADDPRSYPRDAARGHPARPCAQLTEALACPVDWDAEFEADIADLELLIEAVARRALGARRAATAGADATGRDEAGRGCGDRRVAGGRCR